MRNGASFRRKLGMIWKPLPDRRSVPILRPSRLKRFSNSFCPGKSSQDITRLSKPFEIHPALLVLLTVFFVSLMVILWGGSPILAFTTIVWFVLAGTAVVFLILYAIVWLARTIYTRRHPPAPPRT